MTDLFAQLTAVADQLRAEFPGLQSSAQAHVENKQAFGQPEIQRALSYVVCVHLPNYSLKHGFGGSLTEARNDLHSQLSEESLRAEAARLRAEAARIESTLTAGKAVVA